MTGTARCSSKRHNGRTKFVYDALGFLEQISLADGREISYVIDAEGHRVGKRIDSVLVQGFLYGGGHRVVAELDGSSAVVSRFVYAGGTTPAWMTKGGDDYRIITDQVDSVRFVVNSATGVVAQQIDYDAFGNITADTNPGFQPFGFAGGLLDHDTGLVNFGVRSYDPTSGRFLSRDPLYYAGGSTNFYVYAGNDPVNGNDPLGLEDVNPWTNMASGFGIGAVEGLMSLFEFTGIPLGARLAAENWAQALAGFGAINYNGYDLLGLGEDLLDLGNFVDTKSVDFAGCRVAGNLAGGLAAARIGSSMAQSLEAALLDRAARQTRLDEATAAAARQASASSRGDKLAEKLAQQGRDYAAKAAEKIRAENNLVTSQGIRESRGGYKPGYSN